MNATMYVRKRLNVKQLMNISAQTIEGKSVRMFGRINAMAKRKEEEEEVQKRETEVAKEGPTG